MKNGFIKAGAIVLAVALFVSCSKKQETVKTRTIVDQVGHEVVLPEKINKVVIASLWPIAATFCQEFGTEKLVGLDPAIISAAKNSMLVKKYPEIVNISTDFSKAGYMNAEELVKLNPDVVLYATGVMEDYDVAVQVGVPAVGFALNVKGFNAVETINSWIELLGKVMNVDIYNSDYVKYGTEMMQMVESRVSKLSEDEKPSAMFIHRYGDGGPIVGGSSGWGDYWITASGAKNVAAELKGSKEVNMEQVYQWNPEKIYITNFTDVLSEDLYENRIEKNDWSSVSAVQNGEVYKVPLGMYRWYVTCSDSPIMLLWMAKQNQPKLFSDIDFDKTIREFYKKFYDLELSDDDLNFIMSEKRDAAGGIKKY